MRRRLEFALGRRAPMGYDCVREFRAFLAGLAVSFLYSLRYVIHLFNSRSWLFQYSAATGQRMLRQGAVMEDFAVLVDGCMTLFPALALCMALTAVWRYAWHWRGSRSIYTMRRLPDRWELHRRCLAVPVCTVLISLALGFAVFMIYYGIYFLATPGQCLAPGQWERIWTMEVTP